MSHFTLFCIAVAALVVGFVALRGRFWYLEGKKLQTSGYLTPASPKFARWTFKAVVNIGTRLLVGPVTVLGRENARFSGRGLVLPNHVITWDFGVVGKAVPFSYRQLSKAAEIKSPVIATLAAWIGTVGVQVEGGKSQDGGGQAVIDAGSKILSNSRGARMLLFPQGKLVYDGTIEPQSFRTGATRMLQKTNELIDRQPLYALPVAIHYKREASEGTALQRFFYRLGLEKLRTFKYAEREIGIDGQPVKTLDGKDVWVKKQMVLYGATVVIGKPIPMTELPADPRAAIEYIRQRIETQLATARAQG